MAAVSFPANGALRSFDIRVAPNTAISNSRHGPSSRTSFDKSNFFAKTVALAVTSSGISFRRCQLRQRRSIVAARFYGGKARSYKDFNDPWLSFADNGFDPLNLATQGGTFDTARSAVPETTYYNYRESEVKHGRFAMGAFVAIFAEENDKSALLNQLGLPGYEDNLDATLGLDEVQAPVLFAVLAIQVLAELGLQRTEADGNLFSVEYKRSRCPGDLGFDPLGFARVGEKKTLHNTEVQLGRLAMIGITTFLVREFVSRH